MIAALAIRFAVGDSFFTIKTLQGEVSDVDIDRFKNISFGILLGSGIIAFLTGFFGFFFTCCKKKCYAIIFGIFLSFTWLVIIVLGCIVTTVSYGSQSAIQAFCDGTMGNSQLATQIAGQLENMDNGINSYINDNMCSQVCPCNEDFKEKWATVTETVLNSVKRTKASPPSPGTANADKNGNVYMIWRSSGTQFQKFTECSSYL